ncbi:MAG: ABC transporter substrate-binding protein [Rubrivivax sp.]|nr:ABC transporter substrate-binding protein [Rubrivivax sp.]
MQRRTALLAGASWLGMPAAAWAQPSTRNIRIGILFGDGPLPHEETALREGLRELGYAEGRNLVIERRYAEGRVQLVPGYARELAAMNLDAVISTCTPTTRVAMQAFGSTPASTPIIMAAVADPVGQQLIASLARPGANVTGLASQAEDIVPKMLELLGQVLPKAPTVAVLVDSGSAVHPRMWRALGPIAQRLNIQLVKVEAGRKPSDGTLPDAFDAAVAQRAAGMLVLPDEPYFVARRADIAALAARHRLAAIYGLREYVDEGGLMSYGENMRTVFRDVATYVARVAGGARPGDLPVSQPTRFDLVVNLGVARALGVSVPQTLLLSATEVVR